MSPATKSPRRAIRQLYQAAAILFTLTLIPGTAWAADPFVCFPTCSRVDGRMLSVAGVAGNGLVQDIVLRIAVSGDEPGIEVDVFDADTGANWDSPGGADAVLFELFADPNGDGTGVVSVLGPINGNTLVGADNNWVNIVSLANVPAAQAPSGNFIYRLQISLANPLGSSWSSFKVRTKGVVSTATLTPIPGIFALTAPLFFNPLEIPAIYPNAAFFEIAPTSFDGNVDLFVEIPNDTSFFEFFEGDSDRGKGDGTDLDTDDPNSDNLAVPPFAVGTNARPEGVATVDPGCTTEVAATACPADDRSDIFFQRSPSIQIRITKPDGTEFLEDNPSGELEWERIRLSTAAVLDPTVDDFITDTIPAGLYQVRLEGIDLSNLNAFSFSEEVVGLCQGLDKPCRPTLRSFNLGDTVFLDLNGDGTQQGGEPGLGGVIVDLKGSMGTFLSSTVTDGNGNYEFEVSDGQYTVEIAAENFAPPAAAAGSVGDRVWFDLDGDAIDSGEPGLGSVTVELVDTVNGVQGDADDVVIATTQTDVDGFYIFNELADGTYYTQVDESTVNSGLSLSVGGSNPSPTRTILAGGVCSEPDCLDLDFPYTNGNPAAATAGDRVWFDTNGDGVQDASETGLSGVTLQLTNTTTGRIEDLTTTVGGFYLFTDLIPGDTYVITVTDQADVLTSLTATFPVTNPSSVPFTPLPGDVLLDKDFGYNEAVTATIADRVWSDDNFNGVLDGAETGLAGVTINLLDVAGNSIATTTTAGDGTFSFSGLPVSLYRVIASDLDGVTAGRLPASVSSLSGLDLNLDGSGVNNETFAYAPVSTGALEGLVGTTIKDSNGDVDSQADLVPIGDPADNNPNYDFGYIAPGTLGDRVWQDTNGDGVQDNPIDEPGIVGVTVELFDPDTGITLSTTTGPNGIYSFTGLRPNDDYVVTVIDSTLPADLEQTFDLDDPAQPINTPNTTVVSLGTSAPGVTADRDDVDFGYQPIVGSIGDRVWLDLNNDGVQDDPLVETGINGLTVELLDGGGLVIDSQMTSGDGNYLFENLPAGNYTVRVVPPAGLVQTFDIDLPLDNEASVTLNLGDNRTDVDFGYLSSLGSIGDRVWHDLDGDGVQDAGENGINDVTVELLNGGGSVITSDVTSGDGNYFFGELQAGTYTVRVVDTTLPEGFLQTFDIQGPLDDQATVTLGPGEDRDDVDFGYADECLTDIDFETDGNGGTLSKGQIIDDEWAKFGVTVTTDNPIVNPAMIFYSGSPTGGDYDLGTPNEDFGGPGIGSGGSAGAPGANTAALGNVLIISEDGDQTDPDDDASGGTLIFTFAHPVRIDQIGILDIDEGMAGKIRAFDAGGAMIGSTAMANNLGNNSVQTVTLGVAGVSRLEVLFPGSGAVTNIEFCVDCQVVQVRDNFSTDSFNNNNGADDWAAGWIENDPQSGGAGPSAGQVQVHDDLLTLDDQPNTGGYPSAARQVDLSGTQNATLSFKFLTSSGVDPSDAVTVEVSSDGGATWSTLEVITNIHGAVTQARDYDISAFASSETQIRFRVTKYYGGSNEFFCLKFVEISTDCANGSSCQDSAVRDNFNAVSFGNNDGPDNWSADWIENDPENNGKGPWNGQVQINNSRLVMDDYFDTGYYPSVARQADLSGVTSATLHYIYLTTSGVDSHDEVLVEASSNGGSTWTVVDVISGITGAVTKPRSIDISAFASGETQVRFRISKNYGGSDESFLLEFVEIEGKCPGDSSANSGGPSGGIQPVIGGIQP